MMYHSQFALLKQKTTATFGADPNSTSANILRNEGIMCLKICLIDASVSPSHKKQWCRYLDESAPP